MTVKYRQAVRPAIYKHNSYSIWRSCVFLYGYQRGLSLQKLNKIQHI